MPVAESPVAAWAAAAAAPDYALPLPGGRAMRFRPLPAGDFLLGSRGENPREEPRLRVVIPRAFWLGKFVVTQAEWRAVAALCPALRDRTEPSHFKGDRRPVEQVSWDDATAWCDWLRQQPGLPADLVELRLPTDAEWEYACRAGTDTDYHNGDGAAALAEVGWFAENSGNETHAVDEPVQGRAEAHPAGLVGMHGNVWEWCRDVFDPHAARKRPDPWTAREWTLADAGADATHYGSPLTTGQALDRVLRGGSWDDSAWGCRTAFRIRWGPDDRYWSFGFRVCLVRGPAAGTGSAEAAMCRSAEPFWLGETPVTQAQFAVWTTAAGVQHENNFKDRPGHPAEQLDWRQANAFCDWLTRNLPPATLPPGFDLFCLPTEAEWEYACRAGTDTDYYSGDGAAALAEVGWFEGNAGGETHAVDEKPEAHPFGLRGMHGNVWEWCHDLWNAAAYRSRVDDNPDPGAAARLADWQAGLAHLTRTDDDRRRVLRGGSWVDSAWGCRAAFRHRWGPAVRFGIFGFRVCLVRGPAARSGATRTVPAEAARAAGVAGRGTRPETDGAGAAGRKF